MDEIREAIAQPVYGLSQLPMLSPAEKQKGQVQIYEDQGGGFSEEQSFFLEEDFEQERSFRLIFEGQRRHLRIDPCSDYCIVFIKEIRWNDRTISVGGKELSVNGIPAGEGVYAFDTPDPNITLHLTELEQRQENVLEVSMQVTRMPEETVRHMRHTQKRGFFNR